MSRMWRVGFRKDFIVLILVTVLLGSALASSMAALMDRTFSGAVRGLIGDFGEFDVIVHVREEARSAAGQALQRLLREKLPGARSKDGVVLAGKANLLVSIPAGRKEQAVFESLPGWMASLPGYTGITYITEPSMTLSNVHPGVRTDLKREMAELAGVRFVYRDGSNLTAVLESPDKAESVYKAAQNLAAKWRVLEIRYPFGSKLDAPEQIANEVEQSLQHMWGADTARDVTLLGQDDETGSFIAALGEMKKFLLSYSTQVEIDLAQKGAVIPGDLLELTGGGGGEKSVQLRVYAVTGQTARAYVETGDAGPFLEQGGAVRSADADKRLLGQASLRNQRLQLITAIDASLDLLNQISTLARSADGAVADAEKTLQTFASALVQLDAVQEQVRQINEELTKTGKVDTSQLLISALLSTMMRKAGGDSSAADLENLDVAGMKESLAGMSEQLTAIGKMDVDLISQEIQKVRTNLPQLNDQEIGDSLRLIDRYLEGQVLPGDRLQLLLAPQVDIAQSEALVRTVVDNQDITLYTSPAALANPDARSTLFSVLSQVRRTIAGIMALVIVMLVLLLDHATLFSAARRLGLPAHPWAAATGAMLLTSIYLVSRAGIPGVNLAHVALAGTLAGWVCSYLAPRLSPVDGEEIEAGLALGLNVTQVLREIVIPAGRPGLLLLLNRPHQAFR